MVAEAMGALSYACPTCRVRVGRPCRNRRGYLVKTHPDRVRVWLADEYAEQDRHTCDEDEHRSSEADVPVSG